MQLFYLEWWTTALCLALVSYLIYVTVRRNVNLPPGPWGLPLIGYLPVVRGQSFRHFWELKKSYGDVFSIKLLGSNVIVLNSYEAIRECFLTRAEDFSGRIVDKYNAFGIIFGGLGFQQEEGPTFREYRRFSLHTLRDFGFGKLSLEGRVQEIGGDLIRAFRNSGGKPYDPLHALTNAPFNVIIYLTTDKYFQPDDPEFKMVATHMNTILSKMTVLSFFTGSVLARFIPTKWQSDFKIFSEVKKDLQGFTGKLIQEHEDTFEESNLRDFIDAYLAQRYAKIKEGKEDNVFTIDRLKVIILNFILAGSKTTSSTLYWALRLISGLPEIQAKIRKELDEVVGKDRLPSILDRPNMPYMEAFILELLRYTTIIPLGLPHTNSASATLCGYTIPAKSVLIPNLWGVHNDPEFWEEPEKFDPDRFLDPATKAKRRDRVVSFSIGKRSCPGESLSRMEIFLFLTMLLQKFTFEQLGNEKGRTRGMACAHVPEPYEICALPRTD